MKTQSELYETVTASIIAALENGTAPWIKPWKNDGTGGALPHNAITGRCYHGINTLLLWGASVQYGSNAWITFNACKKAGGMVRKGEKGTMIVFWKFLKSEDKETKKEKTIPMLRTFYVFNVAQCDDLTIKARAQIEPIAPTELDAAVALTKARISYGGDRACYSPSEDKIYMPNRQAFSNLDHYHGTLLHELTHWTAHASRNARDLSGRFGNQAYAAEELIAEIGSAFLCASLGIPVENLMEHNAAYIASWIKVLKDDSRAIFTAAKQSQLACDFILAAMDRAEVNDDEQEQIAA